ncbi:MAG: hypothetical protein IJC76_06355 [Lachnospiraceae bacterium]|nr:hypothetical protein [Lachnospiraceae bacterium]
MSIQSAIYYEKKMSYEEGYLHGLKKSILASENSFIQNLLELGADKELIEKAIDMVVSDLAQSVND